MKIYAIQIFDISEKKINELCLAIDKEKKHRIERLINKKDKIRTLIGEILIRVIINEELGINNKDIKFKKNKYGKPYLEGNTNFNFNISHSGDFVLVGIDDKPIGVDIEKAIDIEYEGIAKSFFTKNEFNYIIESDLEIKLDRFYEIWTLKESYIKCCGQGLSIALDSFSINIDENIKVISDIESNKYIFRQFNINSDYKISICSKGNDISNNIIMIDQSMLIDKYCRLYIYEGVR